MSRNRIWSLLEWLCLSSSLSSTPSPAVYQLCTDLSLSFCALVTYILCSTFSPYPSLSTTLTQSKSSQKPPSHWLEAHITLVFFQGGTMQSCSCGQAVGWKWCSCNQPAHLWHSKMWSLTTNSHTVSLCQESLPHGHWSDWASYPFKDRITDLSWECRVK